MMFKRYLPLLAAALLTGPVLADSTDDEIQARIAPVGQVYLQTDEPAAAESAATVVASAPRSGETVYNTYCMACHSTGAAGAPKIGDAPAWSERSAKGLDMLVNNAITGINGMPPRGTCMDCSDDEIKVTVEHMLANSQ